MAIQFRPFLSQSVLPRTPVDFVGSVQLSFMFVCVSIVFVLFLGSHHGVEGQSTESKPCEVPDVPKNGHHTLPGKKWAAHQDILTYGCNDLTIMKGHENNTLDVVCENGEWNIDPPECLKMCLPLTPETLTVTCTFEGKKVMCTEYSRPGTSATAICSDKLPGDRKHKEAILICQDSGDWKVTQNGEVNPYLFSCEPDEEQPPESSLPEDESSRPGYAVAPAAPLHPDSYEDPASLWGYPWTAVIYIREKIYNTWAQACLGTLISPYVVLTAARCLTTVTDLEDIKVGLGKHYRDYYKDERHAVVVKVGEILIHPGYTGQSQINATDIGLLDLIVGAPTATPWPLIIPVSVNWDAPVLVDSGTTGHVSGWNNSESDTIVGGKMTYYDYNDCTEKLSKNKILVTRDKFCAQNIAGDFNVGKGDRGAGFTVIKNSEHFIVGVLNSKASGGNMVLYTDTNMRQIKSWMKEQNARLEQKHREKPKETCPNGSNKCLQNKDSQDPSSTTTSTEATTTSQAGKTCVVPDPPVNREFSLYSCPGQAASCSKAPGVSVSHSELISVTCTPGHFLLQGLNTFATKALSTCLDGEWDPSLPQCYKVCRPLHSLTLKLECWQGPILVKCDKPMLPGTIVQFSCKEYYDTSEKFHINSVKCNPDGNWSRELPYCTPKCGISNLNTFKVRPTIVGGNTSEAGNFPWHAGIYHKNSNNAWDAKCGGTLISTGAVLTAAHCVTLPCVGCKSPAMDKSDVMVMVGKLYRDWQVTEGSAVQRAIKEIRVHQDYVGSSLNYGQDIAVLLLASEVEVNIHVMPACVDFSSSYSNQLNEDKALKGYVAGWGNTEECFSHGRVCNTPSDVLKYGRTTIIDFDACFAASQAIKRFSASRLTTDKFCSGNGSESVVQQGDSGGGLTFEFGGLHFVFGVVSTKLNLQLDDKSYYNFGAFTNVTKYMSWLKIQLY